LKVSSFPYIIKHKNGKDNIIVDALSRRYTMLSQLDFKIFGLETIEEQYLPNAEFKDVCKIVEMVQHGTNSSSVMDLCSVLTNYASPIVLFVFCYCRRDMEED
jgi:hypothetical protein